jgi:hypothetical protein
MNFNEARVIDSSHEQWLDKLWDSLFDGNSGGLMSPGQIRREHRDRDTVRRLEMKAILEAEQELNDVHNGSKTLDDNGNLIDTPSISNVKVHQIIENTAIEQQLDVGLDTSAAMLRSVVKEISVRDLERSLNIRKIAILAETEIINSPYKVVNTQPVNIEWLTRWRESAETVFNPELQLLWAKFLVLEVAQPGHFNLGLMSTLLHLNTNDLEMVRIMSKYAFADFIFYASESYFKSDVFEGMFDVMEELGIVSEHPVDRKFSSISKQGYELLLPCQNKALLITHTDSSKQLVLPVLKLTRVGKQVLLLCDREADLAYMFDLARHVKSLGFNVSLGDYLQQGPSKNFIEKMAL